MVRHSRARRAELTLTAEPDGFTLVIRDDGIGLASAEGTGITGMRERAHLVGGELAVTGSTSGTQVELHVPAGRGVGDPR